MRCNLVQCVRKAIRENAMVCPGDRVAVAVSGGADSVALLLLLAELREEFGVALCVIHFNHKLRGEESDADEAFVKRLAKTLGLDFVAGCENVALIAKRNHWNLEDAGRRLRYRFFEGIAEKAAATRVATAHTADDQAETVLARIIRGTGAAGLASIYPVRGKVIRPLLDVRRAELRDYLASIDQEWREDSSNADTSRLRARVRKQLLPELERNFSAAIVRKLIDLAAIARDEEMFWGALLEERFQKIVRSNESGNSIGVADLLSPLPWPYSEDTDRKRSFRVLTQRIIRKLYSDTAAGKGELSRKNVEQVIGMAEFGTSGKFLDLPGEILVSKEFDRLIFGKRVNSEHRSGGETQSLPYAYDVELSAQRCAAISVREIGREFHLKVIDWPSRERETSSEGVVLDRDRLRTPLVLRNWRPGDAYQAFGRQRSHRVARMLIARRVGRSARASWPVLTSGGRVVWADRFPVASEFSVTEATRTGLWIFENGR